MSICLISGDLLLLLGQFWPLRPSCWLQDMAFITFLCSGKKEALWLGERLSPGSARTRALPCPNPPSMCDVHTQASVSSQDQAHDSHARLSFSIPAAHKDSSSFYWAWLGAEADTDLAF